MLKVEEKVTSFWQNIHLENLSHIQIYIWDKFFKIVILPKIGYSFFNFEQQLLHIFQWDGQNQDVPYDQFEEESQNICLIFS